jgi:SAM-dependent methyltransferase
MGTLGTTRSPRFRMVDWQGMPLEIDYVHGYSEREAQRLVDQADAVRALLHHDTSFPPGSRVLEAGCGVGAQTLTLARQSPGARIVSIDISPESLQKAEALVRAAGLTNVEFRVADLFHSGLPVASFDHVFVCYVLEHLTEPTKALAALAPLIKPGGSITVIEGDHGSCFFHPETPEAMAAWRCLIEVQARLGGDSLIGRRLYPLLTGAGFRNVAVSPRMVYCDGGNPALSTAFVARTITAMVEGVRDQALELGLMTREAWEKGIADLYAISASPSGTFCYTFFKATAIR